jgi:hypothetical protein
MTFLITVGSRDRSFSIATGYNLLSRDLILGRDKGLSSVLQYPDRVWEGGYRGLFARRKSSRRIEKLYTDGISEAQYLHRNELTSLKFNADNI